MELSHDYANCTGGSESPTENARSYIVSDLLRAGLVQSHSTVLKRMQFYTYESPSPDGKTFQYCVRWRGNVGTQIQ